MEDRLSRTRFFFVISCEPSVPLQRDAVTGNRQQTTYSLVFWECRCQLGRTPVRTRQRRTEPRRGSCAGLDAFSNGPPVLCFERDGFENQKVQSSLNDVTWSPHTMTIHI